jgi:hypothetical protein
MVAGIIWTIAGALWVLGAYWQWEARQPVMAAMHFAVGSINAFIGVLYFTAT